MINDEILVNAGKERNVKHTQTARILILVDKLCTIQHEECAGFSFFGFGFVVVVFSLA